MPTKNALHHGKTMHIACRRCGKRSYHVRHKTCSHCGYGSSSKMRKYSWTTKNLTRSRRIV